MERREGIYLPPEGVPMMLRLKACPKCRGDMSPGEDKYGKYLSCLQCGLLLEIPAEATIKKGPPIPQVEERQAA